MEKNTQDKVREDVKEINALARQRLKNALEVFYGEPENMEKHYAVLDEVLNGYMFNTLCTVPIEPEVHENGVLVLKSGILCPPCR